MVAPGARLFDGGYGNRGGPPPGGFPPSSVEPPFWFPPSDEPPMVGHGEEKGGAYSVAM